MVIQWDGKNINKSTPQAQNPACIAKTAQVAQSGKNQARAGEEKKMNKDYKDTPSRGNGMVTPEQREGLLDGTYGSFSDIEWELELYPNIYNNVGREVRIREWARKITFTAPESAREQLMQEVLMAGDFLASGCLKGRAISSRVRYLMKQPASEEAEYEIRVLRIAQDLADTSTLYH